MSATLPKWPPAPVAGKCLYFMTTVGGCFVKIGTTSDLARRLREVQSCCPLKISRCIEIAGADSRLEWAVHEYCISAWQHGEWFSTDQTMLRTMANVTDFDSLINFIPEPIYAYGKVPDAHGALLSLDDARTLLRSRAQGDR